VFRAEECGEPTLRLFSEQHDVAPQLFINPGLVGD
jgi:hypothetical protein